MTLGLYYKEGDVFYPISHTGDVSQPLSTVHDGKTGDIQTMQVYLRNEDANKWFSNVIVKPVDLVDANPYGDIIYNETGWGVKLSSGEEEPTQSEWDDIPWGEQINMGSVGSDSLADTTTYFPFWYLITCPPNTNAQVKTDIVLNLSFTENSVV